MTDQPQYLVAVIKPRLDRVEDAERHLRALMAGTHQEPGCIYMELVISDDDPDTFEDNYKDIIRESDMTREWFEIDPANPMKAARVIAFRPKVKRRKAEG